MTTELPAAIAGFFNAHNTGATANFSDLFTDDAVVSDEQHEFRGAAIREWMDDAIAKYHPLVANITHVVATGDQHIVTAQVSGNFPGSPTELRYRFTLAHNKIAALFIGP